MDREDTRSQHDASHHPTEVVKDYVYHTVVLTPSRTYRLQLSICRPRFSMFPPK
jgi:hypothetical protein